MKTSRQIVLIAHNLRSCHNVGSLLRTAEGLGVKEVILSGYTPYPLHKNDTRLPHLAVKQGRDIHKTALGAEDLVKWHQVSDISTLIADLKKVGFEVWALEQTKASISLPNFKPPQKCAIIIGREVEGLESEVLALANGAVEIPMAGQKESFNVVQAAAMALYHCIFN